MTNQTPNPYAAPSSALQHQSPGALTGDRCPRCGGTNVKRPTFTWWGGMLGPKLFSHAVCGGCSLGFNYKTGKSNATAITIYLVVGPVVIGLLAFAVFALR